MTETLFSEIAEEVSQSDTDLPLTSDVRMTPREQEVIGLVAAGKCNKDIATELGIGPTKPPG